MLNLWHDCDIKITSYKKKQWNEKTRKKSIKKH